MGGLRVGTLTVGKALKGLIDFECHPVPSQAWLGYEGSIALTAN